MEGIITKNRLETSQYFGDLQSLLTRRAPSVQFFRFVLSKRHHARLLMADISLHTSFGPH
jgi:hypothetical protein